MKLSLQGRVFYVQFHHDLKGENGEFPVNHIGGLQVGRCTTATMYEEFKEHQQEVAVGKAYCSLQDQFSRAKGRKTALAKLLKNVPISTILLDDEDRKYIWETYFQNFRKE